MTDPSVVAFEVEVPWKEMIEADPERGVALYDERLRLAFANPAARALLDDPTGTSRLALLEILQSLRMRIDADATTPINREVILGSSDGFQSRATISRMTVDGHNCFLVRLSPPGPLAEPTIRTLTARFHLTDREAEVALAVSKGFTNQETASRLKITEKTVKNALMVIFKKFGVRSRVEMALVAHDARFERP